MNAPALVAIPAFNEENNIVRTIRLIRQAGHTGPIVVIDDGSTDSTAAFAKKEGAQIIRFSKNQGKAKAVFAAFQEAVRRNSPSLVTFDADMLEIPKKDFDAMVNVTLQATQEKKKFMVTAFCKENSGIMWLSGDISGIRAYSAPAIRLVHKSPLKSKVIGFGIEQFLNLEVPGKGFMSGMVAADTLRQGERQAREIRQTLENLKYRIKRKNAERMRIIKRKLQNKEYKWQQPNPKMDKLLAQIRKRIDRIQKQGSKGGKLF